MRLTRRLTRQGLLPLVVIAAITIPLAADQTANRTLTRSAGDSDLATAKPGRDPNQPIDQEYTRKIKQYTTETFFLSPLVDYPNRRLVAAGVRPV